MDALQVTASSEHFKMPVAVHVLLFQDEKTLLLRRFNTGYEDGKYSVIAGHMDGNEDVKSAAIREAAEEAGIHLEAESLSVVGVMHRRSCDCQGKNEKIDFFLVAEKWSGQIVNKEPHKCSELTWFPLKDLPDNVIPHIQIALTKTRMYGESVWFDSIGWGDDM